MFLSVVLPVFNEEKNLKQLFRELNDVLGGLGIAHEIIAVNDGSVDNSWSILKEVAAGSNNIKLINFRNNFGQTAAISAGIKNTRGDIIITLDSDLQNDPADIPGLLKKIDKGFDVVSGWRKYRQDAYFSKIIPSKIANWLIRKMTGVNINDFGCTLKAYRREIVRDIDLYGEMHRFIPAYAAWSGARISEITVNHRARESGKSNYGIVRVYKVILDLLMVVFLFRYMNRPLHFFGGAGFISFFLGLLSGFTALIFRLGRIVDLVETPLPILSALLIIVGVVLIAMGVLAEMIMRVYYGSDSRGSYIIKEKINFN